MPPRPRLTYGVEQRRAIEDELVRDRENAGRLAAAIDHDLGRGPAPPPAVAEAQAAPAAPVPPAAEAPPRGPGDDPLVEAYVREAAARDKNRGKLNDFLRNLERQAPGTATPAPSAAGALGLGGSAPPVDGAGPAAAAPPERPRSEALTRFGDQLGGLLSVDEAPATGAREGTVLARAGMGEAAGRGGARPGTVLMARLAFLPGEVGLPPSAEADLGRALAAAREAGGGLRIIGGGGSDGMLGLDRARVVAAALVRLGAPAEMLDVAGANGTVAGDEARVTLAPRS